MPPFRPVEGARAGPSALGILLPPGRRTVIVVRPRALEIDLLLVRRDDRGAATTGFHEAGRAEAATLAQGLGRALVSAAEQGTGRVEARPAPTGPALWVHAEFGPFLLVACGRCPGQAYRPLAFASEEEAAQTASALAGFLCPGGTAEQELYINTQHFAP